MEIREMAKVALKEHRSGWVKLGKTLRDIGEQELWRDWGFSEFKDYCKTELGISPMTAKQMVTAYEYLKKNEPNLLVTNGATEEQTGFIPDYCSINLLSKAADASDGESKEAIDKFKTKIFDENLSAKDTTRELRGFLKEQSGAEIMSDIAKETKTVKRLAKKLVDKLNNTSAFAPEIIQEAEALEKKIEAVGV